MGNKRLTNTLITKLPPASASIIRSAKLIKFVRFYNRENVKIRKCWSSINQFFPYQSGKSMGGLGWFRRDAVWGVWSKSGTTSYRFPPTITVEHEAKPTPRSCARRHRYAWVQDSDNPSSFLVGLSQTRLSGTERYHFLGNPVIHRFLSVVSNPFFKFCHIWYSISNHCLIIFYAMIVFVRGGSQYDRYLP